MEITNLINEGDYLILREVALMSKKYLFNKDWDVNSFFEKEIKKRLIIWKLEI